MAPLYIFAWLATSAVFIRSPLLFPRLASPPLILTPPELSPSPRSCLAWPLSYLFCLFKPETFSLYCNYEVLYLQQFRHIVVVVVVILSIVQ